MNQVVLSGRLAAEISEHNTEAGNIVVHFPLAVRKNFKRDEDGRYPVNYFQIEAWNALAKICRDNLSKGHLVNVTGRLESVSYDDRNGQKRYATLVVASTVEFLTPKKTVESSAPPLDPIADLKNLQPVHEEMSDESLFQLIASVNDEDIPF